MKEGWMKNDEGWIKNDKVWMKNDEGWKMNDEKWWFQAVEGFCFKTNERTNGQTNEQTFAIVESLSRLKNIEKSVDLGLTPKVFKCTSF